MGFRSCHLFTRWVLTTPLVRLRRLQVASLAGYAWSRVSASSGFITSPLALCLDGCQLTAQLGGGFACCLGFGAGLGGCCLGLLDLTRCGL